MTVEKTVLTTPSFTGAGCRARVTDQVVLEVDVPGGRQTVNFPVVQLPQVAALVASVAADADVADLHGVARVGVAGRAHGWRALDRDALTGGRRW